jgi:hypothetical protein
VRRTTLPTAARSVSIRRPVRFDPKLPFDADVEALVNETLP